MPDVGAIIKEIRKHRKITLQELAEATSLSVGFLSNLERNLTNPTLTNLQRVCEALRVRMVDVVNRLNTQELVERGRREELYVSGSTMRYELLTNGWRNMRGIVMTIAHNNDTQEYSWGHSDDQLVIAHKGALELEVGGRQCVLMEGDSVYINAHTPYKYRRQGEGECVTYWILCGYQSVRVQLADSVSGALFPEPQMDM